jgi:hypothetical protein
MYILSLPCIQYYLTGRAIPQAVSRWLPTVAAGFEPWSGHMGFLVNKMTSGMFSPSTSVSPANLHSGSCSKVII